MLSKPLRGILPNISTSNDKLGMYTNILRLCCFTKDYLLLYTEKAQNRAFQAGGEGFEPPYTDSESAVLPLDEPPVIN